MADKNISLKGRYDDGFCLMESDLVKSLIINLIDNAKKAIDDSGNILVVGRLTEEGCLITVADTGRGMKPEDLRGEIFLYNASGAPVKFIIDDLRLEP